MKSLWGSLWTFFSLLCIVSCWKFTIPTFSQTEWSEHNRALSDLLGPLHHELAQKAISPKDAAQSFTDTLTQYFSSHDEFIEKKLNQSYIEHEPRTVAQAKKAKNQLRRKAYGKNGTVQDRKAFHDAVRAVSHFTKEHKKSQKQKSAALHEKKYKENFYDYSKQICNGSFGSECIKPQYSKHLADQYYPPKYSKPAQIDFSQLDWLPDIQANQKQKSFDMSSVRPKTVKMVLQSKKATSAPGPDGMLYGLLKNLPATHHFMATLFSQLLMSSPVPPDSWSSSKVSLLFKAGDPNEPSNFRMISLTSCVSKVFHQILANRTTDYLTGNSFLQRDTQKAFINGINGCIEHNMVLQEVISHSKANKKTCHIMFFDLADAFGSVSHQLISFSLKRFDLPLNVCSYIDNLYSSLNGYVKGPTWQSKNFKFSKGVFQGDPLSPIIFLACFNPVLEYLQSIKDQYGYDLNGTKIITTPYADDFNLITTHKKQQQKIINNLQDYTQSMGLQLKPSKCRSLSLLSGRPTAVNFTIAGNHVKTLDEDPQKFLGSLVTFSGKTSEIFTMIKDKLNTKLSNIDNCLVRNEYKVNIYSKYFLPSIRFILTVHDLHKTHLTELDTLSDKYLKAWLGVPKQGANNAFLHEKHALNIPRISDLYEECHCLAYSRTRLLADPLVNHCLDSKLERESEWTQKSSTIATCASVHSTAMSNSKNDQWKTVKSSVKTYLKEKQSSYWSETIEPLIFQGDFVKLLQKENQDLTWKSIISGLPQHVLRFATNACINSLPSPDNLLRWGKKLNSKCALCGNTGTLHHILSNCTKMMDRYTWRHNSVLSYVISQCTSSPDYLAKRFKLYADIEGYSLAGATVPPFILPTQLRPDLVLVWEEGKEILVVELTVPFEPNIEHAQSRKTEKYTPLISDLNQTGYHAKLVTLEIGARGYIPKQSKAKLMSVIKKLKNNTQPKLICDKISRIVLLCSYSVFNSRNEPVWNIDSLLKF